MNSALVFDEKAPHEKAFAEYYVRSKGLAQERFSRRTLKAIVDETAELVICRRDAACYSGAWEVAKAVTWEYQNVSFFVGGAQAWKEAGYPVETGK